MGNHYLRGDIDFNGIIDMRELRAICSIYDAVTTDANYNYYADAYPAGLPDGVIDIFDVIMASAHMYETTPWRLYHQDPEICYTGAFWHADVRQLSGSLGGGYWSGSWINSGSLVNKGVGLSGSEVSGGKGIAMIYQGYKPDKGFGYTFPYMAFGKTDSNNIRLNWLFNYATLSGSHINAYYDMAVYVYLYPPTKYFTCNGTANLEWLEFQILVSTGSNQYGYVPMGPIVITSGSHKYLRFRVAKTNIQSADTWDSFSYTLPSDIFTGANISPNPFYFTIKGFAFGLEGTYVDAVCQCDYLYWYKSITGSSTGSG